MAFRTDNTEFDRVFGKDKTLTEKFLEKLTDYLETRKMITPFSNIYYRIRAHKNLSAFACRYDLSADMTEILSENEIPCIKVLAPNGKIGFITSSDDDDAVLDLQKELLQRLGRFMPVFTGEMMRALIDGKKHTAVISLGGLTKTEAYLIRNQCRKETSVQAVGFDRMNDGTYKISIFAEDMVKKGEKNMTLAQTFIKTKIQLYGPYAEDIAKRIDRQEQYEDLIAKGFDLSEINDDKPVYLLGEGSQYVKISKGGMEYGEVHSNDGRISFKPTVEATSVIPTYNDMLLTYTSMLVNPTVSKNLHELASAIASPSIAITNAELREQMAEKAVMSKIAEMLESKQIYDPVMKQAEVYDKKFENLVEKTKTLLLSTITGDFPHEYSDKEQTEFNEIVEKSGLNMISYREMLTEIRPEILIETKAIRRLNDLSEITKQKGEKEHKNAPTREELHL